MATWKKALEEGLVAGSVASVLSTVALAAEGRRETGSAYAPTNAVSHWLWGDEAFLHDEADIMHTAAGYAIHHATSVFWATLYSRFHGQKPMAKAPSRVIPAAAVASALACFVDYRLTPRRLTPGFENRLSTPAMLTVYSAFGLGLALANLMMSDRNDVMPRQPVKADDGLSPIDVMQTAADDTGARAEAAVDRQI
ncbi:MAG: hypothetical protein V4731_03455 [Pseudomonadota bacterium]